jgi:hypothetical protein
MPFDAIKIAGARGRAGESHAEHRCVESCKPSARLFGSNKLENREHSANDGVVARIGVREIV